MDINKVTAKFMSNRKFAEKMESVDIETAHQAFLQEVDFYKERALELTIALLNERDYIEPYLTKEVLTSFNTYMRACISFFKVKDLNDINQKEYIGDYEISTKTEQELEAEALQELDALCGDLDDVPFQMADTIMMRQIQIRPPTLDKFIKYEKTEAPIILPKQREIDLEHPDLKTKPFFPPPPPNTPYPTKNKDPINEVREIAMSTIEDILAIVIDKLKVENVGHEESLQHQPQQTPVEIPIEVEKPPTKEKPKKKKKQASKPSNKPVESLHIDI